MAFQNDPKPPKFWGGFNAIGAAGVRALHGVNDKLAPYLKKINKDSISYKRNGFDEVVSTGEAKPYLYGRYLVTAPGESFDLVYESSVSPEDHITIPTLDGIQINSDGGVGDRNAIVNTYSPFVGDKYVLQTTCDDPIGGADPDTITWLVLKSVEGGNEFFPGEIRRRHSVSHVALSVTGLGPRYLSFTTWATGWENDDTRYRYGFTTLVPDDLLNPMLSRTPACVCGNTGSRTLEIVSFPAYPLRNHFDFTTFTAGPGKLQALIFCDNLYYLSSTPNLTLPYAAPFLAYSNNHGQTWASTAMPWLTAVLCPSGFNVFLKNSQMEQMAKHATITYIGGGKTMLFIPNAYISGPEASAVYAPALFLGDGTTYTRLTWPADDWHVTWSGSFLPGGNFIEFSRQAETRAGHHGFGDGCYYVWAYITASLAWKILYTHDYGDTWDLADVPALFGQVAGAVITPYVSPERPGRIIFAAPDYDANTLSFYAVTGDFAEFKNLGTVVKAAGDLIPSAEGEPYNYFFVNYGGLRYRPYVFPAYPTEFEKP